MSTEHNYLVGYHLGQCERDFTAAQLYVQHCKNKLKDAETTLQNKEKILHDARVWHGIE